MEDTPSEARPEEPQQESRRSFLRRFIPERSKEDRQKDLDESNKLVQALDKAQISRRRVLAAAAGAGSALALEHTLNGLPSSLMRQFLNNPDDFLTKVGEKIQSGTLTEEIEQAIESRTGSHGIVEMGERVELSEEWLDRSFVSYEVRKAIRNGEETNNLLLIAEPAHVKPLAVHFDPLAEGARAKMSNFTKTVEPNHPCSTLPSNQVHWDTAQGVFVPYLYSAYLLEDGSRAEYFEEDGQRRNRGGALVVEGDRLKVVSANEAALCQVGQNDCRAIETVAFTVSSETKAADLLAINNTEVLSGAKLADSPRFDSFVATFKDKAGNLHTKVLSTYQYLNTDPLSLGGDTWKPEERMTVIQGVEICDQLMKEQSYDSYVIAIPDPEEQSRLVSSDTYGHEDAKMIRNLGVELRVPDEIRGEAFGQKIHRTVGMQYPIDTIQAREHFLITKNN